MGYQEQEQSVENSSPILLYHFIQGATHYFYNSTMASVSYLGQSWTPAVISPGGFSFTGDRFKDMLTLTLGLTDPLAQALLGNSVESMTTLTILRSDGDVDWSRVYWKGRVARTHVDGFTLSLECEPVYSSLRRMGVRAIYTKMCRHALFGAGCNLDSADFAVLSEVTAVAGATLTIPSTVSSTSYAGGMLRAPDGTYRTIAEHVGITVTLTYPIVSLATEMSAHPTGFNVQLFPSCDHAWTTCRDKFANLGNFGGFPFIPSKNPFISAML